MSSSSASRAATASDLLFDGERQTGQMIVRVALDCFVRQGYAATSMREIARDAGIQPPSIYNHFQSKEDILWSAYSRAIDTLGRMQATVLDEDAVGAEGPERELRSFVRTHARFHAAYSPLAMIANSQMASLRADHYQQATQWRDAYEQRLRELLHATSAAGVVQISDVKMYSYAVLQMGMAIASWFRPDGEWSVDEVVSHYDEMAIRMLRMTPA